MREPFNTNYIASVESPISPYVVLMANNMLPQLVDGRLRVIKKGGKINDFWRKYIEDNADIICMDIVTMEAFFNEVTDLDEETH